FGDSELEDSPVVDDTDHGGVEAGVSEPLEAGVDDVDDGAQADDDIDMDDDSPDDDVLPDDGMNDDAMNDDAMQDDELSDDAMDDESSDDSVLDDPISDDSLSDDTLNDDESTDDVSLEAGADDGATDDSTPDPVEGGAPGSEQEASVEPPEPLRVLEIVPAPGDDGISIGTNLVLSFDRAIELGSGTIEITNLDAAE